MCCATEAGSYLRFINSCITQLKAQGPSRTCKGYRESRRCSRDTYPESYITKYTSIRRKEEEEEETNLPARWSSAPGQHEAPSQFEKNYFTEMCSGSEAGSYLRLIDFVYHSTLGLRVIKKKKTCAPVRAPSCRNPPLS